MYSEHSDAKIMKCNRYLKQNFPLKPLLQGELILSRCSLPYELPFPDTEVSKSVFIAQNQPLRCFGAGVAVPKPAINTVHRPVRHRFGVASPREDATEVPVGRVAVPKTR